MADENLEVLSGIVERVTYHNVENGYCVIRVKARGHKELVTVVGHAAVIAAGEFVQISGIWSNDRTHGLQLRANFLKTTAPTTLDGIEKYLGSGMIRGIGPVYAEKLTKAFAEAVFDIIEESPERLREVTGIGEVRAQRIIAGWTDQKVIREIMLFLHANGVGTSRAVRIFKTYGAEAVQLISENPYRLARDIRGIGFRTADQVAAKLGIEKHALIRIRAGVSFALAEAMEQGHCGLPLAELLPLACTLLQAEQALIETALALELTDGNVIADGVDGIPCVFLAGLYYAEREIAQRLQTLAAMDTPWPRIDAERAIPWVEGVIGFELAQSQRDAVHLAVASKVLVMTGGPGVGKTTLVKAILTILRAKGTRVAVCAPTGRAAKRLSESTGLEAKTIHRLLEADPSNGGFKYNEQAQLDCDLLVVDETSMVDVMLMRALMRALPTRAALLLVGDVDQLPSVGPGQVLADLIHSNQIPVVRLLEVFRQAAESRIVTTAHRINRGLMPELATDDHSDFFFVNAIEPEDIVRKLLLLVRERIPRRFAVDPIRDIQVLCPMNRGGVGARSLNLELQAALNHAGEDRVERFGTKFIPGDKIMQVENNYEREVYNGDLGIVRNIDRENAELVALFDGREITYAFDELDELVLAYATTIHKSQGSEYPVVVIPLTTQHYPMLARNVIYTGITRGKRLVVLVGQKKALAIALRGGTIRRRWSKLREWLSQELIAA